MRVRERVLAIATGTAVLTAPAAYPAQAATVRVGTSAQLSAALASVTPGTVIELAADTTFTGEPPPFGHSCRFRQSVHMDDLYPPIPPRAEGMLDVGDGHRIYCQEAGNPQGKPVVVLHGGPGSGIAPMARRHFDPEAYRIILFDQRGAGRSTPHIGEPDVDLSVNTLWHLVSDMEKLRERLNIERWQVFGGSWGATLALAYAETHPSRVSELILRGVFTVRRSELDWIYGGGAANLFPREWEAFLEPVPENRRDDPMSAYRELVYHPDKEIRERAAVAWSVWEGATVSLRPDPAFVNQYALPRFAVTFARLALHYFSHGAWLEEGQLIRDAGKLSGIPGVIVQGRYDAVCPPVTAYELHRAWPDSKLELVEAAGHAVTDPGILAALRAATDAFRDAYGERTL